MRVAAIDIGTNSILLTIAEPRPGGGWSVLLDRCRIERLGQGVDEHRALDPAAIARALAALDEYAGALRAAGVTRAGAVGTQALREVKNAEAFLAPAAARLGFAIEIISGEREAQLSFAAVMDAFPELSRSNAPVVVMDVGGGSTELIVGQRGQVTSLVSVPIGAVRLTERHLHRDPPAPAAAAALQAAVAQALAPHRLPDAPILVGVAGTVTSLAAVELGLATYDAARVQGSTLSLAQVAAQLERYLAATVAERRAIVGLEPRRADVIPAGAAIVAGVMQHCAAPTLLVSDRGLRFGLLAELAHQPA
jgi:exopolyphosphatase/guanosine-5'-triphosphate,3'-diphosphate pyrophosphatase